MATHPSRPSSNTILDGSHGTPTRYAFQEGLTCHAVGIITQSVDGQASFLPPGSFESRPGTHGFAREQRSEKAGAFFRNGLAMKRLSTSWSANISPQRDRATLFCPMCLLLQAV